MTHYPQIMDGEWVMPEKQGYMMECCDCGLVHRLNFRVLKARRSKKKGWSRIVSILGSGYRVQLQAFRDEAATARARAERVE